MSFEAQLELDTVPYRRENQMEDNVLFRYLRD